MTTTIQFTDEQEAAVAKAITWYKDEQTPVFELTGYAGTGKTTLIKHIVNKLKLDDVLFAAYTGKAARVINKASGFPTSTIHSLIYTYIPPNKDQCAGLFEQINSDQSDLSPEEKSRAQQELDKLSQPRFALKTADECELTDAALLVLDECSMVDQDILNDLLTFNVPIIALGDPGQLPPIHNEGALFRKQPNAHLEKIHRQAMNNPIIAASFKARKGIPWAMGLQETDSGSMGYFNYADNTATHKALLSADQILCGKHVTRREVNVLMRKLRGFDFTQPYPQVGEKLVCRRNNKEQKLLNGDVMIVTQIGELYDNYIELWVMPEDGDGDLSKAIKVNALRAYFDEYFEPGAMKRVQWWMRKETQEFDFGYVITIHTSQGSQWNNLCLIEDGLFRNWSAKASERKKLLYTAVTRAAKEITILYKR